MASVSLDLPDIVVVTGTASGLGAECAMLLGRSGATVVGVDVASPTREVTELPGYRHVLGNVADQATWEAVLAAVDDAGWTRSSSLGFLGSAAILHVGMLLEEDLAVWERTWQVNVMGNVLALRALLPRLVESSRGSAVVVTSVNASSAEQQLAHYNSSKGALEMAVRTIALDYARTGVTINLLAPGPMRAGLFERHLAASDDPDAFLATRTARQPVGRIIGADEAANAAAFLLSAQASGVFGTTLTVDGGLTTGFDFRPWASAGA